MDTIPHEVRTALERAPGLLIDGQRVEAASGETLPCIDPSTGGEITRIAAGGASDVDRAVAAARAALDGPWRGWTPTQRQDALLRFADLLERHADELAAIDSLDMGAPRSRGAGRLATRARYYAGWATKIHGDTIAPANRRDLWAYTRREPVGVVAAIIPWNGPCTSAVGKLAPALAVGCTVVLKPAEDASLGPLRVAELAHEAGYPPGVVNVVTGTGPVAGAALAAHPGVDKVTFTGSPETGRRIVEAAAGNLKRVSLELGGKSPNIVFADADLDAAVPMAAMGAFFNTGQVCVAGTRLFVERPVHDQVVEAVAAHARRLRIGPGMDPATDLGPLVSARQLDRVEHYLALGHQQGAEATSRAPRPSPAADAPTAPTSPAASSWSPPCSPR